jgi:hypothetical protein
VVADLGHHTDGGQEETTRALVTPIRPMVSLCARKHSASISRMTKSNVATDTASHAYAFEAVIELVEYCTPVGIFLYPSSKPHLALFVVALAQVLACPHGPVAYAVAAVAARIAAAAIALLFAL